MRHAIHSPFYWRILKKTILPLVSIILTKETRKLEFIHEEHFVERKNEGRKPDQNLSLPDSS